MKTMKKILAVFGLLALSASAEARYGKVGDGRILFASEGQFSHDNNTTASVFVAGPIRRNTLGDGDVIKVFAACTIGTVDNEGATLTIGCYLGGTDMLTAAVIMDGGRLFIEATGVVRSTGSSGTILWSIVCHADITTAVNNNASAALVTALDSTADTTDFTLDPYNGTSFGAGNERGQLLGLSFDWTAAVSTNTLRVEQLTVIVE